MAEELKILIVTDKFKGSLTASQAAESIRKGILQGCLLCGRKINTRVLPMADGGDGTIDVIMSSSGGEIRYADVFDPLLRQIKAPYLVKAGKVYIEMAKCSGLQLLKPDEYNPLKTSTYGLGQMILAGINDLTKAGEAEGGEIIIGIGGSATNDGGMGMLRALGYKFMSGNRDKPAAAVKEAQTLGDVIFIDDSGVTPLFKRGGTDSKKIRILVACDVNNPLLGARGASSVYGPQKGADTEMVEELECGMLNYARICERFLGKSYSEYPGAGAAGGVGFALVGFLGAETVSGWKMLSELTDMESLIKESDLVLTGEGSLDEQSISGKLVSGVAEVAKKHNKSLWAYCGVNSLNNAQLMHIGIEKVFVISDIARDKEDSIMGAQLYLEKISSDSATFLNLFQSNRQTN